MEIKTNKLLNVTEMCLAFDGVLKPDGRIKKWASNIRRIFVAHVQELTKTVTQ